MDLVWFGRLIAFIHKSGVLITAPHPVTTLLQETKTALRQQGSGVETAAARQRAVAVMRSLLPIQRQIEAHRDGEAIAVVKEAVYYAIGRFFVQNRAKPEFYDVN